MAIVKKRKLSGSTGGKAIKLTTTETSGAVTVHTAVEGTTDGTYDEIWLWAYNGHTEDVDLTVEFGGSAVPDENIVTTIPFKAGLVPITPGLILQEGLTVKAFASVADVVTLVGFVNTITD